MNQNFIYILPFADNKHFKIGISSNDFSRLKTLNKLYQIDFAKSYIVYSKVSNIKILERELLEIFDTDDCDKFDTDGHTEIRNVKYLNECVELIKNKHSNLKYDLQQFDIKVFDKVNVHCKKTLNKISKNICNKIRTDLNQTIIMNFVNAMEDLFNNSHNVTKFVSDDVTEFELDYITTLFKFGWNSFAFKLITETYQSRQFDIHGVHYTKTIGDNINAHFRLVDSNFITGFEYNGYRFDANDETKQLIEMFRQTLEMKYYCQSFDIQLTFDKLLNQNYIQYPKFISTSLSNKFIYLDTDDKIEEHIKECKKIDKKIAKILA